MKARIALTEKLVIDNDVVVCQGGEDDLVSAAAWEEDGETRMRFIRRVRGGAGDHDMGGVMTLIWAHGQLDSFYKQDQLKYHGKSNRGINVIGQYQQSLRS